MTAEDRETINLINDLQKRYCDHLDNGDIERLMSLFAADCVFEAPSGRSEGKSELEALMKAAIGRHKPGTGRHVVGTGIAYRASESTVYSTVPFMYVNFDENAVVLSGEYLDRWQRIDDQWLLGARDVRVVNGPSIEQS